MQEPSNHLVRIGFDDIRRQYWGELIISPVIKTVWADSIQELRDSIMAAATQNGPQKTSPTANPFIGGLTVQIDPNLCSELERLASGSGLSLESWVNLVLKAAIARERLAESIL